MARVVTNACTEVVAFLALVKLAFKQYDSPCHFQLQRHTQNRQLVGDSFLTSKMVWVLMAVCWPGMLTIASLLIIEHG